MRYLKKNKKAFIAFSIFAVAILSVIIVASIIDIKLNTIESRFENSKVVLEGIEDQSIYAIFKYDADTIWYIYKEDHILDESAEGATEQITNIWDLLNMADSNAWHSANFKITEDIYDLLCKNGIYYYTSLSFDSYFGEFANIAARLVPIIFTAVCIAFLWLFLKKSNLLDDTTLDDLEVSKSSTCKFSDIIGHDEILTDLKQYVNIMKSSNELKEKGVHQPKGLLLTGEPGTGKTLIAKALAGEAGVKFIRVDSSAMIDRFVGMGAANIRKCFKKAREQAPCILFIDEIDAIGGKRGAHSSRTTEDDKTLLALLQEMDGFSDTTGILVIGATNAPESLDPALLRAGRFDREIKITAPEDKQTRRKLLELYTEAMSLSDDLDLDFLARQTQGFTGADIAYLCNEAAIIAAGRCDGEFVLNTGDFIAAIDKMVLKGNKRISAANEHDRLVTAYHEAGHAVMSYLAGVVITRVTIRATTSGVGGYVMKEDCDYKLKSKRQLINDIYICYAGRCSEELFFGSTGVTTGAYSDIQTATKLLLNMVTSFGYDGDFGLLDYSQLINLNIMSSDLVTNEVRLLAQKYYTDVKNILVEYKKCIEALANELLIHEEIRGEDAVQIIENTKSEGSYEYNNLCKDTN